MSTNPALTLSSPTPEAWSILWRFIDRLRNLGYTEQAVSEAMGVNDHARRDHMGWPAHIRSCRRNAHPSAILAAFFLIEGLVEEALLLPLLGTEILTLMRLSHWIVELDGKLHFRYLLYPLLGNYILTDGYSSNPPGNLDQVYQLGADSHLLARMTPRTPGSASLDHCTGSGVHAVLSAGHENTSTGVDINPRALQFAQFNAKLNQRRNAHFFRGDCYQALAPAHDNRTFDLVTANPPFVPTPEALSLYRGGGVGGEEVTEKIIRGLPKNLSREGVFAMITNIPIVRGQSFFSRCEQWLNDGECWSMLVLTDHIWSLESYVISHQSQVLPQEYGKHFQFWLDAYESVGLEAVTNSQVYLFRSPHAWRLDRLRPFPKEAVPSFIEDWISSLRSYGSEGPFAYRLHPGIKQVSWLDGHSKAYVEWQSEFLWWEPRGVWVEGAAAQTLAQVCETLDSQARVWGHDEGLEQLLSQNLVIWVP